MNISFILYYVLIFIAMTALLYVAYWLIFRTSKNFRLQRFMLLCILGLSLLMPFNPVKIKLPAINLNIEKTFFKPAEQAVEMQTETDTQDGLPEP
ncbi:MAG: hypothetical protein Q4G48_05670, partial [Bacteroidia bacterium]|nr:hypothetical protein [Bacteroidia bacterium]